MNRTSVDSYLSDGCGRCDKYQTPDCKVLRWTPILVELRQMVRASGLTETMKWGSPCYCVNDHNVVMLVSFKDDCALQFFQGLQRAAPERAVRGAGQQPLGLELSQGLAH